MINRNLLVFAIAAAVGAAAAFPLRANAFTYYRTFRWPMAFSDDSWLQRGYISSAFIAYEDNYAVSMGTNVGMRVCLKPSFTSYSGSCPAFQYLPATSAGGTAAVMNFSATQIAQFTSWQLPYFEFYNMGDTASAVTVKAAVIEVHQ